jgi:hypothetical protein
MRGAVLRTSLASFDSTCEFLDPTNFDNDKLPPLVERFLDPLRNVDDLRNWYALVLATNESIKDLHEVEGVSLLPVRFQIVNLRSMLDGTLATQRYKWTYI